MTVRPSITRQKRIRRPSVQRREEIVAAAVRLWAKHGYHATSVAHLCKATGIGKGAFYHHIGSKEEILFEIHNRFVDPMVVLGRELLESDLPPSQKLVRLSSDLLEIVARYQDYVAVFFREMQSLSPERIAEVRAKRHDFEHIIDAIIQQGIDKGDFRPVPVRLATLAFLGMHNYAYTWFHPGGPLNAGEIASVFSQIFLSGVEREHAPSGSAPRVLD